MDEALKKPLRSRLEWRNKRSERYQRVIAREGEKLVQGVIEWEGREKGTRNSNVPMIDRYKRLYKAFSCNRSYHELVNHEEGENAFVYHEERFTRLISSRKLIDSLLFDSDTARRKRERRKAGGDNTDWEFRKGNSPKQAANALRWVVDVIGTSTIEGFNSGDSYVYDLADILLEMAGKLEELDSVGIEVDRNEERNKIGKQLTDALGITARNARPSLPKENAFQLFRELITVINNNEEEENKVLAAVYREIARRYGITEKRVGQLVREAWKQEWERMKSDQDVRGFPWWRDEWERQQPTYLEYEQAIKERYREQDIKAQNEWQEWLDRSEE